MKRISLYILILSAASCSLKNEYGIAPYHRPVDTASNNDSTVDIRNDTTILKQIQNTGQWDASVQAYEDLQYDAYLTRYSGWNGGDGNYSHVINDTTTLWTFQDSFIGTIDNTRNRDPALNKFVRNAAALQYNKSLQSFVQLNQGTLNNSKTWLMYDNLESNDTKELYWAGDGHVVNGKFQLLLGHLVYNNSGGLDHPGTDLAVFSIPDMALEQVIKNKVNGDISYDAGIFDDDDGYTYIYGNTQNFLAYDLHIARAPDHDLTANWQFLTANGWADNPDNYTVLEDAQTLPNIIKKNNKYYMISQGAVYGHQIYLWESNSPTGPFTNRRTIYYIPDFSWGVTYNTTLHQSLSTQGELVIAYNTNPNDFAANFNAPGSADLYRPHFVRLYNWE
ncbi:hypothetical protein A9P82_10275 [Arachidicoccus ginsenosidimutans]|uniref:DUF5005 domain-containing protein n=1 Tax=Arachidicoccus sp. BS20 TaxID=1850526 RepID=UPI0007F10AC9|nr:DUF5005 domain-containing protein [Arachidicoccus sp. BS20]ANI89638.1 hypothetical protein A9P82_10275 [Arachidicoccus sp. BS20]